MAIISEDVPYLVTKPGKRLADGTRAIRAYWQPSKALKREGWSQKTLPDPHDVQQGETQLEAIVRQCKARTEWVMDCRRRGLSPSAAERERLVADRQELAGELKVHVTKAPARGTFGHLELAYKGSRGWLEDIGESTQKSYEKCIRPLAKWCGEDPLRGITSADAEDLYNELRKSAPAMANAIMRQARLMWNWGRRLRVPGCDANPFAEADLVGLDFSGRIWSREAVRLFVEAADKLGHHSVGTAVMINAWLGQRQGDVLRLPLSIVKAETIVLRQGKTTALVQLPIGKVDTLMQRLTEEAERRRKRGVAHVRLLLTDREWVPWKQDHFRNVFREIRAELAKDHPKIPRDPRDIADLGRGEARAIGPQLEAPIAGIGHNAGPRLVDADATRDWIDPGELQFLHLRHTAVVRLAEAECTDIEISAISGHSLETVKRILEHYLVRTSVMADSAFDKRLELERKIKGSKDDA